MRSIDTPILQSRLGINKAIFIERMQNENPQASEAAIEQWKAVFLAKELLAKAGLLTDADQAEAELALRKLHEQLIQ